MAVTAGGQKSSLRDYPGYRIQVVSQLYQFAQLHGEWDELAVNCGASGFFNRYIFIRQNWERHRSDPGKRLNIVIVYEGDKPVLAAPMFVEQDRFATGVLYWLDAKVPGYSDLLVADPENHLPLEIFWKYLQAVPRIRKFKANYLLPDSPLLRLFEKYSPAVIASGKAYSCDLSNQDEGNGGGFASSGTRKRVRYLLRKLEDIGPVAFEVVSAPEVLVDEIAWIFAQKREWVIRRYGAPNWLSPPETETYYKVIGRELTARGEAKAYKLTCGIHRVACALCFESDGKIFFSKTAFDPAWGRYSPGWLLVQYVLLDAEERSLNHVDFMIGQDAWKERCSTHQTDLYSVRFKLNPLRAWWQRSGMT
jgi:CelD/BcsL family acetyltransferase involved in cellulose biosynthesis